MPLKHTPRAYQVDFIERCRAEYARGARLVLGVLPTGAGKTMSASMVTEGALKKGKRVLWLACRRELIDQAAEAMPEAAGIIMAGRTSNPTARIQVASIDTLATDLREYPPAELVVYDEAHHITARTSQNILARYPKAHVLGITATPSRGDGTALGDVFEAMVVGPSIAELIKLNYLVQPDVIGPASHEASMACDPVEAWLKYTDRRPGFIFAKTRKQSKEIIEQLALQGIKGAHVEANTPKSIREKAIDDFRARRIDVLSSVNVFTEGVDLPRAAVCLLARGCQHMGTYLQMVGRILRTHEGKTDALVIDLFGQVWIHGLPDAERIWSLDGEPITLKDGTASLRQCPSCGLCASSFGEKCSRCGYEFPPPELPPVEERPMESLRDRVKMPPTVDRETMRRRFTEWVAIGKQREYKPNWARLQFKNTFGFWPKWSVE